MEINKTKNHTDSLIGKKVKVLNYGKPVDGIVRQKTKTGKYEVAVKSFMHGVTELLYIDRDRIQAFDGNKPCVHDRCLVHTCNGDCLRG